MLIKNETIQQRELFLWDFIHLSQNIIKQINKLKLDNHKLMNEVKKQEMEIIKMYYAELKQLKKGARNGK